MTKFLEVILAALLILFIPACNSNKESHLEEVIKETPAPIVKQKIKLAVKTNRAEYTLTNALEVLSSESFEKEIDTSKGKVKCYFVQINGLRDKAIESKLNQYIIDDMTGTVKDYIDNNNINSEVFHTFSHLNANNLLSISVNMYWDPSGFINGFLYNITDGKKIYLKDLFTEGTDYVSLLNRKIIEKIISGYDEESEILSGPFTTISPEQAFVLDNNALNIIFHAGEAGFLRDYVIKIPLSEIDDYIDILDTQSFDKNIFEKPNNVVKCNNIFINEAQEYVNTPNGRILLRYPLLTGIEDPSMEKKIDNIIKEEIDEILSSDYVMQMKSSTPRKDYGMINVYVTFNNYDYISITRNAYLDYPGQNDEDLLKFYTIDLKTGSIIDPKDLIRSYADKNNDFKASLVKAIKANLKQQYWNIHTEELFKTIDYSYIINNCIIYFQSNFNYTKPCMAVFFKNNPSEMYVYLEFDKDLNVLPEKFFKR